MHEHTDLPLTAEDLLSRDVTPIPEGLTLREAAEVLGRHGVHGAPVVDAAGRCVGVLSVSDLARWVAGRGEPVARPVACAFQEKHREPGGHEVTHCRLATGACPFQRPRELAGGGTGLECSDPHGVPVDWQVVRPEALPGDRVRDVMTTDVVTAPPTASVADLARIMLDRQVHRVVILDAARCPLGLVAARDLLQVLAHPELATTGGA